MKRRDFITKTIVGALSAKTIVFSPSHASALGLHYFDVRGDLDKFPNVDEALSTNFIELIKWMQNNGWEELVKKVSGVDLNISDPLDPKLFNIIQPKLDSVIGCDDFIGMQLLKPGMPAESLLYHLLASPRVRFDTDNREFIYPTLEQIDLLENYIYALQVLTPERLNNNNLVLAMFAYEYRPSCKTPHECHADLVFSRTGFSRVGSQPLSSYDRVNRCFTNKPANTDFEKEIAVTPARYGLFLAEYVDANHIENNAPQKLDERMKYLLPIRKIFKNDQYLGGAGLYF